MHTLILVEDVMRSEFVSRMGLASFEGLCLFILILSLARLRLAYTSVSIKSPKIECKKIGLHLFLLDVPSTGAPSPAATEGITLVQRDYVFRTRLRLFYECLEN